MKQISERQSKRMKKLAKIAPPKDGKCTRCGEYPDFRGLQKHHKVPRSRGGHDSIANIEFLCGKCHGEKHNTENIQKSKPVDRPPMPCLNVRGLHSYSREQQVGRPEKSK